MSKFTILFLFFCVLINSNVAGVSEVSSIRLNRHPFKVDGKWGIKDSTGKVISKPKWDSMESFVIENKDKLYLVNEGELYGFINTEGNVIIQPVWSSAEPFSEGLAAVGNGKKFGFINTNNELVIQLKFDGAISFSSGLAPVQAQGIWGYIDHMGHFAIDPKWRTADKFASNLARVSNDDGLFGYIDKKGDVAIPLRWENAFSFSDNLGGVQIDGLWGFVDTSGDWVIKPRWRRVRPFHHGIAWVFDRFGLGSNAGLINLRGEIVSPLQWQNVQPVEEDWLREHVAKVNKGMNSFYLHRSGAYGSSLEVSYENAIIRDDNGAKVIQVDRYLK